MSELSYSQLLLEQVKLLVRLEEQKKESVIDYDAIVAAAKKALKEEQLKMKRKIYMVKKSFHAL